MQCNSVLRQAEKRQMHGVVRMQENCRDKEKSLYAFSGY